MRANTLNKMSLLLGLAIPCLSAFDEGYLFGRFKFPVSIGSGQTADIDLTAAGVINGDNQVGKVHGTAADPEVIVQVNAARLVIDDPAFATLAIAEKAKLHQNVNLKFTASGDPNEYSLRGHVVDPYTDRTLGTAADGAAYRLGEWRKWASPHRIDPRRDQWALTFDAAGPTVTGGLDGYLEIVGLVVPNNVPGGAKVGGPERWIAQHQSMIEALLIDIGDDGEV